MAFSAAFQSHAEDTVGGTPITYAAMAFGTASANRILIAIFANRSNATGTPSSVTIGGITATAISGAAAVLSGNIESYAYYAAVPTGTSGDVVVTYAGASLRSGCAVYSIIGGASSPNGSTSNSTAATSLSTTLTVPSGGASIHIAMDRPAATGTTISWTNSTGDFTTVSVGGVDLYDSASDSVAGNITVTATSDSTSPAMVLSSVAWAPFSLPYTPWPLLGPLTAQ